MSFGHPWRKPADRYVDLSRIGFEALQKRFESARKRTEEELAIFDLLTRPDLKLTEKEKLQVKKVARDLLTAIKAEKLVLDWRKRLQSRAQVRVTIEEVLDHGLVWAFPTGAPLWKWETVALFLHLFTSVPLRLLTLAF